MLLQQLGLVDNILFVHPKDVQDGQVEIGPGDIATNLPYAPDAHLVFPGVPGHRSLKVRLVSAYLARLHAAAAHDATLASAFVQVIGMVAPPQSLLGPSLAVRVLRGSLHAATDAVASSNQDAVWTAGQRS